MNTSVSVGWRPLLKAFLVSGLAVASLLWCPGLLPSSGQSILLNIQDQLADWSVGEVKIQGTIELCLPKKLTCLVLAF